MPLSPSQLPASRPAAPPETQMLARRVLASRGLSPFGSAFPVDEAVRLLEAEARARRSAAWRGIAPGAGLAAAAVMLLTSVALRSASGMEADLLMLQVLSSFGAIAWAVRLLGPAADRVGEAMALRDALRRASAPDRALRIALTLGAPASVA